MSVSGQRAGQPALRLLSSHGLLDRVNDEPGEPVAQVRGVNLYAKQRVHGRDRRQLERLCRYVTRPPVAQDRLTRLTDGTLELTPKRVWKDGTRAIVLEPDALLTRLIAAIPPPRFHTLGYFGVSNHSKYRSAVVPQRPPDDPEPGEQLQLPLASDEAQDDASDAQPTEPPRKPWAWLLRHIFAADLERCPACGGKMGWAEVAKTTRAALRLMAKLGLAPHPPPASPATPLGQLSLQFGN